jgi:hypothetical protein
MLIGIDLGTTNGAVAIWRDGVAELIPNALGDPLTPSAVSIDRLRQTWVGAAALDRMANHPDDTATSFKRLMGTDKLTRLGGKDYRAEDLSALVLMALRDDVAKHTGTVPTEAVITAPAYFNDRQRKATRSGQIAGLDVRRLINELRLDEMKVAQHAGPSQCRAFVQTALLDPDKAVLPEALRRREQALAVELADAGKLAPTEQQLPRSATVPGGLVSEVLDYTHLPIERVRAAMQHKAGDADNCAVATALLQATLAYDGKEREAILRTL